MSVQSRKHRGYDTQRMAARYFRRRGHPFATAVGAGEQGKDIRHMIGLAPEVKATPGDNSGALKQAVRNRGDALPFVVWRPNGYGETRIDEWPVIFTFADAARLLSDAGYGDPYADWGLHDPAWVDHGDE